MRHSLFAHENFWDSLIGQTIDEELTVGERVNEWEEERRLRVK